MKELFIIVVAVSLFACKGEPKEGLKEYTVISGEITNDNGGITIRGADEIYKNEIKAAADGTFHDTLRVDTQHYLITTGEEYASIYIEKGKDLTLNYDANDFIKTLTFSGNNSEINNYLINKRKKDDEIKGAYTELYSLDEDAFKAKLMQAKKTTSKMMADAKGVSKEYHEKENKNIKYSYLYALSMYEPLHGQLTENQNFKASDGFLIELEGLDYNNLEDFEFSSDYRNLVSRYYGELGYELSQSDSLSDDLAFFKVVGSITAPSIKNYLLFETANGGITFTNDLEPFYNAFMANSTNEEHKAIVTEKYDKLKTVARGQSSPKFVGYENYKGGTTSLDDLKGKYVYIDLWATWCRPCIAQIPALKEIEKKYHGKNIEFVSISVDKAKDHDKWKQMVDDMALTGVQLFADNDFNSSFVKGYLVQGIPRFILIDPQGNIVNYSAPYPSEPRLMELFDELGI